MSELIDKNDDHATIRWKLLTGASALALAAYVSSAAMAKAEDASQPQIWIELGGQLSSLVDGQETFTPDFPDSPPRPSIFVPSQRYEYPPRFSFDEEGRISFQPENSNWLFSASVRYGRSASHRDVRQQTYPSPFKKYYYNSVLQKNVTNTAFPLAAKFTNTVSKTSERHMILDFQAGKDVGLGMFGNAGGSSVVSAGVRFAQFRSKSNIAIKSDPDWHFVYGYYPSLKSFLGFSKITRGQPYHSNIAELRAARSFSGVGPSISWKASAPFAGNLQDGELTLDWGVNAALLFGKQKAVVHHQSTERYHTQNFYHQRAAIIGTPQSHSTSRSRDITVPNVGGSVGLSWQLQNFKMSLGYRADFFFDAIDGGIDAAKKENRAFYGPYASISIGLGD
jgi:iron complex outermembrane receptor protein